MTEAVVRLDRHARHILLKEIGGPGQKRLANARIAVVGMGGLGAPAALYLAAAGVGMLRLIDPDEVSLSNLQRQVLYRTADVGRPKVAAAVEALAALDPELGLEGRAEPFTPDTAADLIGDVDLVLDGTDSFAVRLAVNAACHALGKPLVSGAVGRWDGQVATFRSGLTKGLARADRAPCYQCLVPAPPTREEPCAEVGIVGALTGVIGSLMALEAIKELAGAGDSLAGRLLLYDGLAAESRTITLRPDPACPCCGDVVA
jgi:molybdopterin/thiamine biosynthesis adenylyltransferase